MAKEASAIEDVLYDATSTEINHSALVVTNDSIMAHNNLVTQRSSAAATKALVLSQSVRNRTAINGSEQVRSSPTRVVLDTKYSQPDEEDDSYSTHSRHDSSSTTNDSLNTCDIQRAGSSATIRSARSVRSVRGIGTLAIGSLRVHSPSPTRPTSSDVQQYLKNGDIVIVRDIPHGSLIGCDIGAIVVNELAHVEGFKDLPPGAHFFWASSPGTTERVGFWVMTSKKASDECAEIFVRRWDRESHVLAQETSTAEIHNQKSGIGEIYHKLQPHGELDQIEKASPIDGITYALWVRMTSSMKGALLTRITGKGWNKWEVSSLHDVKNRSVDNKDQFRQSNNEVLDFVFPRSGRSYALAACGENRDEDPADSSEHIIAIIATRCAYEDYDEIVGELQFCYITAMFLGNAACARQWAMIVKVVLRAFHLITDLPKFMAKFVDAVHAQLTCDEEGLNNSILDNDPAIGIDLKHIFITFKAKLNHLLLGTGQELTDDQASLGKAFEQLELHLWKWGWDIRSNYYKDGIIHLSSTGFNRADYQYLYENRKAHGKIRAKSLHKQC